MSAQEYINEIRLKPCAFCFREGPSDPHHYGPGGMGTKCSDLRTVSLCRSCHQQWHQKGCIEPFDAARTKLEFLKTQVTNLVDWIERLENRSALFDMTKPRRK